MQNIVKSMLDEVGAMMSSHVIPYHKVAIVVAAVIALLFSLVFSHSTVFEGKIAVIDLDASNYSTALIQKINTSPYIEVTQVLHSPMNPEILTAHDRNYFAYLPTIFMTGLAFGWLALILSWSTQNPGEGASLMTFLVPPGFILGGATMAVGFLPLWAYYISYAFPLVWQYRFYRDFAMRGQTLAQMLPTYGAYLIFLTVIASVVVLLYYRTKRQVEAG
ncbi:TPA: ABC transporter permease [Yersinia enterocolitica]|nr:ABC transporter permease [Yersinia enterocolitica]